MVVVAVRADFERHYWWHPLLGMWLCAVPYEQKYQMAIQPVTGANGYAASANISALAFMDHYPQAEWMLMVDNDTVPPANLLRMLDDLPDYVDVISPLIPMLSGDRGEPQQAIWWEDYYQAIDPEPLRLQEVDRAGGGCTFYRRRVFERLPKPWFKTEHDPETQFMTVSDDVYFANAAKEIGFRLFCDTRYKAAHYHTVDLLQMMK